MCRCFQRFIKTPEVNMMYIFKENKDLRLLFFLIPSGCFTKLEKTRFFPRTLSIFMSFSFNCLGFSLETKIQKSANPLQII